MKTYFAILTLAALDIGATAAFAGRWEAGVFAALSAITLIMVATHLQQEAGK